MTRARRKPAWPADRKTLVCEGGPRDRAWYFDDDWSEIVQAAIAMGETPHAGRTLGYIRTSGLRDHPKEPNRAGTVLRWNPDMAAELIENGQRP